jgi:hypothetical protein
VQRRSCRKSKKGQASRWGSIPPSVPRRVWSDCQCVHPAGSSWRVKRKRVFAGWTATRYLSVSSSWLRGVWKLPVQIGAKAYSFSDPTGLLADCHRRIEMFLRSLEGIAIVIDRPLTGEARSALETASRYFREAAPKHTADEEDPLFPRLRQMMHPDVESAIERLERLEHDHLLAGSPHIEVEQLGQPCLESGRRIQFSSSAATI